MTKLEAQQILALYRPGSADQEDPFFREARQMAASDPELARWFEAHCESYVALRKKFQAAPIPPGLKEQILSERKVQGIQFRKHLLPALAAAAIVVLVAVMLAKLSPSHGASDRYAAYRKRMTEKALRVYDMKTSSDPVEVRDYLRTMHSPADFTLAPGLQAATIAGCVATTWQGQPVSMICFKSGRPLAPGDLNDLWLFVCEEKSVPNAPPPGAPEFARVNKAMTASWSADKKNYLLVAVGDEAFLRKYLQ